MKKINKSHCACALTSSARAVFVKASMLHLLFARDAFGVLPLNNLMEPALKLLCWKRLWIIHGLPVTDCMTAASTGNPTFHINWLSSSVNLHARAFRERIRAHTHDAALAADCSAGVLWASLRVPAAETGGLFDCLRVSETSSMIADICLIPVWVHWCLSCEQQPSMSPQLWG